MDAKILDMLSNLGATSYQEICRTYFTAKMIIAYNNGEDYADTLKASRGLHAAITGYRQIISYALSDDNADRWSALCHALHTSGLDVDMHKFFDLVVPNVVADWIGYLTHLPDRRDSTILIALIVLLASETPTREAYAVHADVCGKINLTYDRFQRCWNRVHACILVDASHTPAPCISDAMRLYHKLYLPMTDLLTDYYRLYLSQDMTTEKQAIKGGRRRERTTIIAEGGKTAQDTELESALRNLAQAKPTDVIRGLFYGKSRNDAALECTYLLRSFASTLDADSKALIVNPSPDMILWCRKQKIVCNHVCFLVTDEMIAELYQHEFPDMSFRALTQSGTCPTDYDRLLLVARGLDADKVLTALQLSAPCAKLLALVPEVYLTGNSNTLQKYLCKNHYSIRQITAIPTAATESAPRKKVLIHADTQWCYDYCQLITAECDDCKTALTIPKQYSLIPHKWLEGTMSIADMRKAALASKQPVHNHLNDAHVYWYSPEIQLRYTLQSDCKNRCAGRVYYRAILRPEDKHRKRGDRLSPIIEKGLRKNTEAEVIAAIEQVAMDERISDAVVSDVLDYYFGRMDELSIKTMWYCLRNQLRTLHTYRENLALEMFSSQNQSIAVLNVGRSTADEYEVAVQSVFPAKDHIPKAYWQQLHLILSTAQDEGYIKHNHLSEHMRVISHRADKRQREVRNALVKKILENDEERRIMDYLLQMPMSSRDGLWILGPIIMFAVPHLREALALRWMDFEPGLNGAYHLNVTKYLCDDGTVKSLLDKSVEAYRSVPTAPILAELLLDYKKYLMERYELTEEQIAVCPIVLENHTVLKKGIATRQCKMASAVRKRKELIEQAAIPANDVLLPTAVGDMIRTNLNNYQGDIFYSNLKYHLRHVCKMTEGELCYFLGLQAPDTFSDHYCAYDHPVLQHKMTRKLARWTNQFQRKQNVLEAPQCRHDVVSGAFEETYRSDPAHRLCVDIVVTPMGHQLTGALTLQICSRYGLSGTIVCITNEEGKDE